MKLENNWRYKSLENLQRDNWGQPDYESYLVRRCIELSKISLIDFTVEDLRIMIGQEFGLVYLIPLAIEKLKENILAEGDYHPGDLLKNVISIDDKFWVNNKHLYIQLKKIIEAGRNEIEAENISLEDFMRIGSDYLI
jgi:hypothetical protein